MGARMKKKISLKLNMILHHWLFWLGIFTFIGIILRSLPSIFNAAWGVDFGIYYGLTNSFIESKELITSYNGWGLSYNYFPVLYAITGFVHWVTGIEVIALMPRIAPVIGGLTIPIFYFITKELTKNKRISLLAAGLLSVSTFHVYQTSHAAPLTVGHFFMMLSMYLFIKYIKNQKYLLPLGISTVLLILSHHFTTYFFLISITFMMFYYTADQKILSKHILHILFYVGFAATIAFSYWGFIATPVYHYFMTISFLSAPIIIAIFYAFIFFGVLSISVLKKYKKSLIPKIQMPTLSKERKLILIISLLCIAAVITIFTGIPGVYIPMTPLAILYSIPMIVLIGFALSGISSLESISGNLLIKGWIIAIGLSFIYSICSGTLLPDRHLEYLIVPLCIPAALTLNEFIEEYREIKIKNLINTYTQPMLSKHRKKKIALFVSIFILFITNMITAYPTIDALNSIDERVSDPCINSLEWMKGNISNTSVIASDHRISMLVWAEGLDITYGNINETWEADNISDCIDEILKLNISYVIIDDIMRENVINVDVGKYYHFTNQSYDKFKKEPFELVYRNATINNQNIETHWIEIYKLNRSFLPAI